MRLIQKAAVVTAAMLLAATLPWALLFGVNAAMGETSHRFQRSRCTAYCHDHGCRHEPLLPALLTSDAGLFGATVRGLRRLGRHSGLGRRRGYGAVNIAVFCVLWPGLMVGLVGWATAQRLEIRSLRREARDD